MDNINIYLQLLHDSVGIQQSNLYPLKKAKSVSSKKCCEDMVVIEHCRGENSYCMNCGLVLRDKVLRADMNYMYTSSTIIKKRFYSPLTHFKEHLRRYMGSRFTTIPLEVLESIRGVDTKSENAYFLIKACLKKMKYSKFYKEIFMLIYMNGGCKVEVTNEQYNACISDFKIILHYFKKYKSLWNRHSLPSNYMLMKLLLEKNGHIPYYTLPELKIEKCKLKFDEMYMELQREINWK